MGWTFRTWSGQRTGIWRRSRHPLTLLTPGVLYTQTFLPLHMDVSVEVLCTLCETQPRAHNASLPCIPTHTHMYCHHLPRRTVLREHLGGQLDRLSTTRYDTLCAQSGDYESRVFLPVSSCAWYPLTPHSILCCPSTQSFLTVWCEWVALVGAGQQWGR